MKLSTAIRQGAAKTGHVKHNFFKQIDGKLCSCALGAAYFGLRGKYEGETDEAVCEFNEAQCPKLLEPYTHPITKGTYSLEYIIGSLNDYYNWTRERIADWLESEGL